VFPIPGATIFFIGPGKLTIKIESTTRQKIKKIKRELNFSEASFFPSLSMRNTYLARNISFIGPKKVEIILVRNALTNNHISRSVLIPKYFTESGIVKKKTVALNILIVKRLSVVLRIL
jgi:hypothetical protein